MVRGNCHRCYKQALRMVQRGHMTWAEYEAIDLAHPARRRSRRVEQWPT